jgi:MFS superfamily sulfate permease-like transporter
MGLSVQCALIFVTFYLNSALLLRSMLTSLVSALLLLSVLLYLGPYFESLPVCVLGAIIMVSLTGLLLKVRFRSFCVLNDLSFTVKQCRIRGKIRLHKRISMRMRLFYLG